MDLKESKQVLPWRCYSYN